MNNTFSLKNFRVFDNVGAEFEIAPITVLTGCNSSGKSSLIKSLILLNDTFSDLKFKYQNNQEYRIEDFSLNFIEGKHKLGSFKDTLSRYSNRDNIVFSYSKYSNLLASKINVEFSFNFKKEDLLQKVDLDYIKIFKEDVELFHLDIKNNYTLKVNGIEMKKDFFDFIDRNDSYNRFVKDAGIYQNWDSKRGFTDFSSYKNGLDYQTFELFESIINSKNNIMNRDGASTFIDSIKDINTKEGLLFPLTLLDIIDEAKEDDIDVWFMEKTEELKKKITDEKGQDGFERLREGLILIANDFKNSGKLDFREYYQSKENEYLLMEGKCDSKILRILQAINNQNTTFLSLVHQCYMTMDNPPWNSVNLTVEPSMGYREYKKIMLVPPADFETFYLFLVIFNTYLDEQFCQDRIKGDVFFTDPATQEYIEYVTTKELNAARSFYVAVLQETLIELPSFLSNLTFIEAIRADMHRKYSLKGKMSFFSELIRRYMTIIDERSRSDRKLDTKNNNSYKEGTFLRKWLNKFDIGEDISFKVTEDGTEVEVYIINGDRKTLLADEGYGITQLLPVIMQIELNIIDSIMKEINHPLIIKPLSRYKKSTIAIEEPETNLHPRYQSLFAEMIADANKDYNIEFILETHSEYFVRKLQTLVAKKELSPENISLNYIFNYDKTKRPNGKPQVQNIQIKDDGRLSEQFGTGFFDEADNLAMDLLIIKSLN
ncbi:AAA family ATPase [Maribellus mangrovi]|uniref:AAA family ATPase n=1 Tax=Maribellus mangrovi TaxID=3133146 RepID=UPI0030EB755C